MAKINFKAAMKSITETIPYIQEIALGITLMVVVVGVVINAVTSGSIDVPTAFSNFLTNWSDTVISFVTSLTGAVTIALSLLVVVIIFVLFRNMGKKGKSNKF